LPPGVHPETLEQGVAAQLALAEMQGGAHPAGFKIGATSPRMQEYLGLPGPAAGFMPEVGLHGSGSTLAIDGFLRPGVECELAVHLARDLPPGPCTPDEAREAVDELMAAVEIVENRYVDLAAFGAPAMIADQVFHAGAVIAEPYAGWRDLDLQGLAGRIIVNGVERDSGFGRDLLGDPMRALAWLAGSAEVAAFGGLKRGQIVMLGSVCPPIWLDGPASIEVRFPPLAPATLILAAP
jgi:2-keto-4-pentenoate hydratase